MTEIVSSNEYSFSMFAADELCNVAWARELVAEADEIAARIVNVDDKSKLFEIRFAYYLARKGLSAVYEYNAGVGGSSVDFFVNGSPSWLMELVSLRPSNAVKKATVTTGNLTEMELSSLKGAQAKYDAEHSQLGEKVAKKGKHHKFPAATKGSVNCC